MNLPKFIDIELNTSCNLTEKDCPDCPYHDTHKHPQFMTLGLYQAILLQIDWKCSLKLCQRGEPLLSPILFDAIMEAYSHGFRIVINTNGIPLDSSKNITLLHSKLTELILSDYGKEIQYLNGKAFSYMNLMYGYPIYFTVKTDNPKKWEGICDRIVKPVFYDYKDTTENKGVLSTWKCKQLFERLIIEPDGKVRCCCGALHPQKYVGDIKSKSLKKIWFSETLKEYRGLHKLGLSHQLEMCRKCGYRKAILNFCKDEL